MEGLAPAEVGAWEYPLLFLVALDRSYIFGTLKVSYMVGDDSLEGCLRVLTRTQGDAERRGEIGGGRAYRCKGALQNCTGTLLSTEPDHWAGENGDGRVFSRRAATLTCTRDESSDSTEACLFKP